MAPHHFLTCVTSLLVRPMPKVSITVVATTKIVTKEAKNGHIMAIFSHKEKSYGPDTYLTWMSPMIWSNFYHFWISRNIVWTQLHHSFTDVMKVASLSTFDMPAEALTKRSLGSDLPFTRHPGLRVEDPRPMRHQWEVPTGATWSKNLFSIQCCVGLRCGSRGIPGLPQVEAGKEVCGMRKILGCRRLVELLCRRSTAGKFFLTSHDCLMPGCQSSRGPDPDHQLSAFKSPGRMKRLWGL